MIQRRPKIGFCCAVLLLVSARAKASSTLCGSETGIELTENGETASSTVTLSPIEDNSICKLRVTAPKTHVINMQFVETSDYSILNNSETQHHPPCVMSILLPQNPRMPVWKGDICSGSPLPEVDLLTSDFKILWNPPRDPVFARGRKFILTAVGQGSICKQPGQHTCMRIGWDPMMCVSDSLLCDGVPNCPKSSTTSDEDEKLCRKHFFAPTSLEQLAVELFKKWNPPDLSKHKWLQDKFEQHMTSSPATTKISGLDREEWKKTESTTTAKPILAKKSKATDSISQVLSKYGPWGYLMLGMLICGTVLMFCGLWECCFRKPKAQIEPPNLQTQPTTVLIINPQEEISTPNPPNYDDLDQPPSYTTLFPNYKRSSDVIRDSESGSHCSQSTTESASDGDDNNAQQNATERL